LVDLPTDAAPLGSSGVLDSRLFDIPELVRQHRDDPSRTTLPLIVTSRDSRSGAAPEAVRRHARATRALPVVGGSSVVTDKHQLGRLWASIVGPPSAARIVRKAFTGGVGRVWLDGEARLSDDQSNTQIGAPAAWEAGYTGKGVTVAVLDGGYDATHPDLASAVTEAKDFTASSAGVKDTFGHGTHVASTIAGSGAASSGKYKGAAPDAQLLVGKVCAGETCDYSAILAGMEWAAQRAKIVNMSLGGSATDGTDPLSAAVNRLSAQYGTLFVVAAGNAGSGALTVGTPAAADAALAVGSVSKTDRVSSFSSRGPRLRDYAVKPEIVAPGQSIVAARAAGTSMGSPLDANYTSANGTSMATPHVAASAAILTQQHPDWSAGRLKAALTSTATTVDRAGVYDQGNGRLDIARAVRQSVTAASSTVNFGLLKYPQADLPPVTRAVTYANDGDAPVTLALQVVGSGPGGSALPEGAFALDGNDVTVPAHGTAEVGLTVNPKALSADIGSYGGRVTATAPAGITVTTAFGATTEPESKELTIRALDRAGDPASSALTHFFYLLGLDSGDTPKLPPLTDGSLTVRVPTGTYALNAFVDTPMPGRPAQRASRTWTAVPRIVVDKDMTVTLDARAGKQIRVRTDQRAAVRDVADIDQTQSSATVSLLIGYRTYDSAEELYAVPVKADPASFAFGVYQTLVNPQDSREKYAYFFARPDTGQIPDSLDYRVRDNELALERALIRAQGIAAHGTRSSTPFYLPGQSMVVAAFNEVRLPVRRNEFYSVGEDISFSHYLWQRGIDEPTQYNFDGEIEGGYYGYKTGERRTQTWNSAVHGSDISMHPWNRVLRYGDALLAQTWPYSPSEPGQSAASAFNAQYASSTTTLSAADGTVIGSSSQPWGFWRTPPDKGRYTLEVKSSRTPTWSALAPQVSTRWSFETATTAESTYLPLLTLHVRGPFDEYNRAPNLPLFPLEITAGAQKESTGAGEVDKVTVQQSADDGTTWKPARVYRANSKWFALLTHPKGDTKFVSVRVRAEAPNGDAVEQTTIRAYGLK
ncbi:S8 family serine peptidase, partial [Streptomyces sp. NPDC019890]|uniref:S8 family serine peptidase n=1 Tax=Streptomyces sp. NPDC019890 TaxID=3365064 RepID=UPI00384BC02E